MIVEIQAKTMLATVKHPDAWFGVRYNMNIYRGCQHRCIYCDSRSECYGIENFDDVLVKANALELLARELPRKRVKGIVGTGSMSDPYTPAEGEYDLSGRALELMARHGFGVNIITKSDLVLRDVERLGEVNRVWAAVSFTLTTVDDALAAIIEPGAPPPSARLAAMGALADAGLCTGATLMPVLPWITDDEANIDAIVRAVGEAGGRYAIAGMSVTMRDRQRAYYYAELDRHFPELRARYEARYGERYGCPPPNAWALERAFHAACARYGVSPTWRGLRPAEPTQLALL
jgi:DNA repair photolyase